MLKKMALVFMTLFLIITIGCKSNTDSSPSGNGAVGNQNLNKKILPPHWKTLETFSSKLQEKTVKGAVTDRWTSTKLAKETVEQMGYDYDTTFLYLALGGSYSMKEWQLLASPLEDLDGAKMAGLISAGTYSIVAITLNKTIPQDGLDIITTCVKQYGYQISQNQIIQCAQKTGMSFSDKDKYAYDEVYKKIFRLKSKGVIKERGETIAVDEQKYNDGVQANSEIKKIKSDLGIVEREKEER